MRWPWSKPKPVPIPPYQPPIEVKPMEPKDPGMVVEEVDTSDMTKTGVHRAWRRLTGKE